MRRFLALILRSFRAMFAPWRGPMTLEYRLEYLPIDRPTIDPQRFHLTIPKRYRPKFDDYPF